MLPILVPSVVVDCPATLALRAEGLDPVEVIVEGDYGYGNILSEWWERRTGFVLVEHDVAPFPGAVAALWACTAPVCAHQYASGGVFDHALGCTKFSPWLCQVYPDAPEGGRGLEKKPWREMHWMQMDGAVYHSIESLGIFMRPSVDTRHPKEQVVHMHYPAVAHVRGAERLSR